MPFLGVNRGVFLFTLMNPLKAIDRTEDSLIVENYIILYGSPTQTDSSGQYFTPNTNIKSAYTQMGRFPVDWEHGFRAKEGEAGREMLGYVDWTTAESDQVGVKVRRILNRRNRWVKMLDDSGLIDAGILGTSSEGDHLTHYAAKSGEIINWPLIKDTLTVAPIEPRMLSDNQLKAIKASPLGFYLGEIMEDKTNQPTGTLEDAVGLTAEDVTNAVKSAITPFREEFDTLKTLMTQPANRLGVGSPIKSTNLNNKTPLGDNLNTAVAYWVRTGDTSAIKAANDTIMNTTTGADGEYAVPDQHIQRIMTRAGESFLAPLVGCMTLPAGPGKTAYVPFDNESDVEFYSGSEQVDAGTNTFTRNSPALGQATLAMERRDMEIPLSIELIEWEDSNLMQYINDYIGRAFAKDQNSLLVSAAEAGGTTFTLASNSAVSAADITGMVWGLPEGYENNAAWIMRKGTAGHVYSIQGDAFVFKGTPAGTGTPQAPMLEFAPVHFSANCEAVGASNKSLLYGDFSRMGYRNSGLRFQRNPYRKTGLVFLEYHYWAVYKTIISEAIKVGTHPA